MSNLEVVWRTNIKSANEDKGCLLDVYCYGRSFLSSGRVQRYELHWGEAEEEEMTYMSENFPTTYALVNEVFLRDILSEKDGVKFSLIFMRRILDTQVEGYST